MRTCKIRSRWRGYFGDKEAKRKEEGQKQTRKRLVATGHGYKERGSGVENVRTRARSKATEKERLYGNLVIYQ